jgi:aryl-alcohol dehydrogenase-like predicted oxidoreductase
MAQLKENFEAFAKPLSPQIISDIDSVLKTYPMPF